MHTFSLCVFSYVFLPMKIFFQWMIFFSSLFFFKFVWRLAIELKKKNNRETIELKIFDWMEHQMYAQLFIVGCFYRNQSGTFSISMYTTCATVALICCFGSVFYFSRSSMQIAYFISNIPNHTKNKKPKQTNFAAIKCITNCSQFKLTLRIKRTEKIYKIRQQKKYLLKWNDQPKTK